MKILYITKNFNTSGYLILNKLIENNFNIVSVILKQEQSLLNNKYLHWVPKLKYWLKCKFYRCESLKALKSEELLAKKNKIPIFKTDSIKSENFYNYLCEINPEIIVLGGGWYELIPPKVFNYPNLGCINTHPSLLPSFRGTSITRWQILFRVKKSGSTIHYVDEKFDNGKILSQQEIIVDPNENPQNLFLKLSILGGELMITLLKKMETNETIELPSTNKATKFCKYYKKWEWSKDKMKIDWKNSFENIHSFVKANTQESYQYLGPFIKYKNKKYFLRNTHIWPLNAFTVNSKSDELIVVKKNNKSIFLWRKNEDYILELISLQRYSKFHYIRRASFAAKIIKVKIGEKFLVT